MGISERLSFIYGKDGDRIALNKSYKIPDGYYYTKDHEWIVPRGATYLVGITDYAAKMLNDVVYVNLPEVGKTFTAGDVFGQVESVKTVSDVFMPVTGKIVKTNVQLVQTPDLVTKSTYNDGWMLEIESSSYSAESGKLLNAKAYSEYISSLEHD